MVGHLTYAVSDSFLNFFKSRLDKSLHNDANYMSIGKSTVSLKKIK